MKFAPFVIFVCNNICPRSARVPGVRVGEDWGGPQHHQYTPWYTTTTTTTTTNHTWVLGFSWDMCCGISLCLQNINGNLREKKASRAQVETKILITNQVTGI